MVSNPVDVLTLYAQELAGLPRNQIFGTGTFLDSHRLRHLIAQKLNISEHSIQAYVLGEHGDTQFAAWSLAHIEGIPITTCTSLTQHELDALAQQSRNQAYEIIACKGSTYYGIASCVSVLCESILFDQKRLMPLSCFQESYGVCLSLPAILGAQGIEGLPPIALNDQEKLLLQKSANVIKAYSL